MAVIKVKVDEDLCTACEICVDIVPQVFRMREPDHDVAEVIIPTPNGYNSQIEQAIDGCPSMAIIELPLP